MDLASVFLSFPRLHIMNRLSETTFLSFSQLKELTGLSSGNLYSHCQILIDHGYLTKERTSNDGILVIIYRITPEGITELTDYLRKLELYINKLQFKLKGTFDMIKHQLPPSVFIEYTDPESISFRIAEFDS